MHVLYIRTNGKKTAKGKVLRTVHVLGPSILDFRIPGLSLVFTIILVLYAGRAVDIGYKDSYN